MGDDELVVTLCMVCPFEPPEKQALLEARDASARADTLVTCCKWARMTLATAGAMPS